MYSGGLDSTYLLYKLMDLGFTNVHAVAVNLGAPVDQDQARLEAGAAHFGAKFVYHDARDLFISEGIRPALRARARYLGMYPISSSLSRPIIARVIVDYAMKLGAPLLLHTANLSQNSLRRLNNSIEQCGFTGSFGSPYVLSVLDRESKAAALVEAGLVFMSKRGVSIDANLYCVEIEGGPVEDPEGFSIPEDSFHWTRSTYHHEPESIKLGFKSGELVSIDDNNLPLAEAISLLNKIVGKFGHGRHVGLEPLSTGEKVLEVREAPAAAIIMDALGHLEAATLTTKALRLKQTLVDQWVEESILGNWGSEVHLVCDIAISTALKPVNGTVTYLINHTRFLPCAIIAENPRYIRNRDDWELEKAGSCISR
jgi:argininosuccinate synthase